MVAVAKNCWPSGAIRTGGWTPLRVRLIRVITYDCKNQIFGRTPSRRSRKAANSSGVLTALADPRLTISRSTRRRLQSAVRPLNSPADSGPTLGGGAQRSGASRSSSPAIPTSVNRAGLRPGGRLIEAKRWAVNYSGGGAAQQMQPKVPCGLARSRTCNRRRVRPSGLERCLPARTGLLHRMRSS